MISFNRVCLLLCAVNLDVSVSIKTNGLHCKQTCTTPACVQIAAQILQKVNEDISPCDDFNKFACGKYPEDSVMTREGMNEMSSQSAYHLMYEQLAGIIESAMSEDPDSIEYKRKVIYNSCVNSHDLRKEVMLMKKRLSEYYIPNWPNVDDSTHGDIDQWLARLLIAEEFAFINIEISFSSPELYETYFSNRALTVPSFIQNSFVVSMTVPFNSLFDICPDASHKSLIDFLYIIMDDLEFSADVGRDIIGDAIHVDRLIQNFTSEENSGTHYYADCQNASNSNRWCRVFELFVKYAQIEGDFLNAQFNFLNGALFSELDELLSSVPSRAIANHLAIRFLLSNIDILSYFAKTFDFPCISEQSHSAEYTFLNKRQSCASFIVTYLPLLVAQEYISINDISGNSMILRNVLMQLLNATVNLVNTSWMPENMKSKFYDSLARTTIDQLDYVSIVSSLNDVKYLYIDLKPDSVCFFHNIEALKWMKHVDDLRRYEQGYFQRAMLQLNPFNTNAKSGEDISIGFGFYHIPYSGPSLPKFVYYGRFGHTLAHEIVHNIQNVIYNNMESNSETFKEYTECVINLFSKFMIPVINITAKAKLTFGENVADLLGKQIAFEAFLNDVSHNQPQQTLPGLESFSLEQLFFVSSAQDWCEFGSDFEQYLENPHSPTEHRNNGPSMNIESFSNIFNCKKGSRMNPDEKCKL